MPVGGGRPQPSPISMATFPSRASWLVPKRTPTGPARPSLCPPGPFTELTAQAGRQGLTQSGAGRAPRGEACTHPQCQPPASYCDAAVATSSRKTSTGDCPCGFPLPPPLRHPFPAPPSTGRASSISIASAHTAPAPAWAPLATPPPPPSLLPCHHLHIASPYGLPHPSRLLLASPAPSTSSSNRVHTAGPAAGPPPMCPAQEDSTLCPSPGAPSLWLGGGEWPQTQTLATHQGCHGPWGSYQTSLGDQGQVSAPQQVLRPGTLLPFLSLC